MPETSDFVRITASLTPAGVVRRELGRTLFLTRDTTLDAAGPRKVQVYSRLSDVAVDFSAASAPYGAAQVYFGQDPFPRNLLIGRWAEAEATTDIRGGTPATRTTLAAISTGSFRVGGVDLKETDFSGAADLAAVATILQAKIRTGGAAGFAAATVTYEASPSRFVVSFPPTAVTVDGVFEPHSNAEGADVSGLLGLDAASGATHHPGAEAETLAEALAAIEELDSSWYYLALESALAGTQSILDAAAWTTGAGDKIGALETNERGALNSGEEATFAARLFALQPSRAFAVYAAAADHKALSLAGRLSSVNFNTPASVITAKFKTLPLTTPDALSRSQIAELDRKRINHYDGSVPIVAEGVMLKNGEWIDARIWLDWFVNSVQTNVGNLLRTTNLVPQTPAGMGQIQRTIEAVCREGIANGGIAPGSVSAAMAADIAQATGTEFDGFLSNGYLVYAPSIGAQAQADREARVAPGFGVWLKQRGAIHFVDVAITFGV